MNGLFARVTPPLAGMILSIGLFFRGFDSPLGQALSCLLHGGLLLLILTTARSAPPLPWKRLSPPLLCFGGALLWLLLVAGARWLLADSVDQLPTAPDLFLPKFLSIVAGLWALLIGLHLGFRRSSVPDAGDWLLLFVIGHLLLGFVPLVFPEAGWDREAMLVRGRFAGLAGNANVTAAVCGAAAIASLAKWMALGGGAPPILRENRRYHYLRHCLWGFCLFLSLVGLALTASRFPALMSGLALLALLIWQAVIGRGAMTGLSRFAPPAVALILLFPLLLTDRLVERLGELGYDGYARGYFWSEFSALVPYAAFTGYGPGSFSSVHAYFLRDVNGLPMSWSINSPHSVLLQLLLTGGAPYLLLLAAGAFLIIRQMAGTLKASMPGSAEMGYVLGFAVILACGLVDIPLDVPASTTLALFMAGMAWGKALQREAAPDASR